MASSAIPGRVGAARTALQEVDATGGFVRRSSVYRDVISQGGKYPPEKNRYHLYVSLACPWACRCLATMYMKGLEECVGLSITHPTWGKTRPDVDDHAGWQFVSPDGPPVSSVNGYGSFDCRGCIPDAVNGAAYVRDLYEIAGDTNGKYTVPVLWDTKTRTIVNNESADIVRMLNTALNDFSTKPDVNLYPEELRDIIDSMNDMIYDSINNGVYKCGFATSQAAYDAAVDALFKGLDACEEILKKRRYICGDVITETDIRLFMTLIRFDPVYVVYFKTDKKTLREYPALREYVKDLYSIPEIRKSVDIGHIKTHYFTSHPVLNPYAIIPAGPEPWWTEEHDRYKMTKQSVSWEV